MLCISSLPTRYADGMALPFSDDTKAIQAASASVVMLNCYDKNGSLYSTGSAFAAFDEGVFVTNLHVLESETFPATIQNEFGETFDIV